MFAALSEGLQRGRTEYPAPAGASCLAIRMSPASSRLVSLSITECRSEQADQLDITLSDHDGLLELPAVAWSCGSFGWSDARGMVDKGTFEVDEVEFSGPPDVVTLRARSADMSNALRTRHAQFPQDDHQGHRRPSPRRTSSRPWLARGGTKIAHIDQTDESDLAFLNRIGKRYDAVATIKEESSCSCPLARETPPAARKCQPSS